MTEISDQQLRHKTKKNKMQLKNLTLSSLISLASYKSAQALPKNQYNHEPPMIIVHQNQADLTDYGYCQMSSSDFRNPLGVDKLAIVYEMFWGFPTYDGLTVGIFSSKPGQPEIISNKGFCTLDNLGLFYGDDWMSSSPHDEAWEDSNGNLCVDPSLTGKGKLCRENWFGGLNSEQINVKKSPYCDETQYAFFHMC